MIIIIIIITMIIIIVAQTVKYRTVATLYLP